MNQPYFIVVLAHSLHGRLRRIHVPYKFMYAILLLAGIGAVSVFGFVSSYVRMALKVADYNNLRQEVAALRNRYQTLEKESRQTGQQLASLQTLAAEVSLAYGIKRQLEGPADIASEGRLAPTVAQSFEEYNFLKSAGFSRFARRSSKLFHTEMIPSAWPVDGRLMSHFGLRTDPFSGEGAFHSGVDLSAPRGTPVRAAGDGVIAHAEYSGRYGKLIVVDHGNGFQTYYAHLSGVDVVEGQTVRRGDTIGKTGATGRATSPHLHYEVRRAGTPVNPYPYMNRTMLAQARRSQPF